MNCSVFQMNRNCSVCIMKKEENNYLKDRAVCKSWYNKNRRKNIDITLIQSQQSKSDNNHDNDKNKRKVVYSVKNTNNNKKKRKVVDSVKINSNRTLIIENSNCGKTYLMNHILHQNQEPIFIITKSPNQYPKIEAQTSDEIEPLKNYENSAVVFDDMLLSKQESNFDMFFTRGRHNNIDIYYITQSYFHPQ